MLIFFAAICRYLPITFSEVQSRDIFGMTQFVNKLFHPLHRIIIHRCYQIWPPKIHTNSYVSVLTITIGAAHSLGEVSILFHLLQFFLHSFLISITNPVRLQTNRFGISIDSVYRRVWAAST